VKEARGAMDHICDGAGARLTDSCMIPRIVKCLWCSQAGVVCDSRIFAFMDIHLYFDQIPRDTRMRTFSGASDMSPRHFSSSESAAPTYRALFGSTCMSEGGCTCHTAVVKATAWDK